MNEKAMNLWLDALYSTDIPQTTGKIGDTDMGMCCMGVLDYVAFGSHTLNTQGPSADVPEEWELEKAGLNKKVTKEESVAVLALMTVHRGHRAGYGTPETRSHALAMFNDGCGLSFKQIATMIKFFGWDK